MEENGGEIGHSTHDGGCGGLWQDMVEENGTEKWEKNGMKYPFFTVPLSHFFKRLKIGYLVKPSTRRGKTE